MRMTSAGYKNISSNSPNTGMKDNGLFPFMIHHDEEQKQKLCPEKLNIIRKSEKLLHKSLLATVATCIIGFHRLSSIIAISLASCTSSTQPGISV